MSYRELATRPVLAWSAVMVTGRLPVAMAPLALVFLVRERPGGYTLGAVLAAAYVLGEILAAPVLGMRMNAGRARPQLVAGLAVGAAGFTGLGLAPDAHPVVLAALALLAGTGPAAVPGALRALLTSLVPERAVTQAMSAESVLTFGLWAAAPALTTGLALGVDPAVPLLLQGLLTGLSVAGLWLLPAGWSAEAQEKGASMRRALLRAWPVYVLGAAGLTLLALAELVLPALLEQRGIGIGWAGPLLAGFSIGSAVGAFVYGLRGSWPGPLAVQSLVLVLAVAAGVALAAVLPWTAAIAVALVAAGLLQAPASLTRNLALRQVLPPSALAAGYSVMYAAVGAGYAAGGSLAGGLLKVVAPSTAILWGVGLTVLLTVIGAAGERRLTRRAPDVAEREARTDVAPARSGG
ncbi:MFS transporter [Streptomyces litmocidini]|uniref:MFS transporter n=1 Tax=Streptomyces litmocidini TaxID=67318 RepID=A0ABW7U6Q9_9ACTN|nr:MFS transporter [Streptomyces sp. PanSC19]ROQ33658.1 putative MFS family arabinose efflux permease [Streptomyces sp. PanSC19]